MNETNIDFLKIEHVTKRFPGVVALNDVSFSVRKGEVHALVGENGAGKSTLIRAIMGVAPPDEGSIKVLTEDGSYASPKTAIEGKRLGLYANYQHVNFADELSVAENYFLGRMPCNRLGIIDWKTVYRESRKILDQFHLENVDEKMPIGQLPVALREMVTISAILAHENIKLVIFDEPTAQLEDDKVAQLFQFIDELKKKGISIIYISHRLEEITQICDRVTVLRDGTYITTEDVKNVDSDRLISLMIGRSIGDIYSFEHAQIGNELIRVENLCSKGKFQDISFSVREGEILGFFGLVGSGRSEVMRAIYAADPMDSGKIFLRGKEATLRNPMDAMKAGIGLVPEDRQKDGIALGLSVKQNINLNSYDMITKFGIVNLNKETARANEYVKKVAIKTPTIQQLAGNLSGGNQQKIVISKLLCRDLDVLIFDEPTVGIDVNAKQEIYTLIGSLARQGKAIIIISSYLPEVIGLSDRLVVFSSGRVSGVIENHDEMTEENVLRLASIS